MKKKQIQSQGVIDLQWIILLKYATVSPQPNRINQSDNEIENPTMRRVINRIATINVDIISMETSVHRPLVALMLISAMVGKEVGVYRLDLILGKRKKKTRIKTERNKKTAGAARETKRS